MQKEMMAKRALALALCSALAACGGGGGGSGGAGGPGSGPGAEVPVAPPVSTTISGGNFTVAGGATAPLSCAASGGTGPYTFEWSVLDNAGLPVSVASASSAQTTFVAPTVAQATTLSFQCKATDSAGKSALAKTSVTVSAPAQPAKLTADAGLPFTAAPGSTNKLRCDGSGGVAPYSYQWRVLDNAGSNLALSAYSGQETSFTAPAVGSRTAVSFQCVVIDSANAGATSVVSPSIAPSINGLALVASAAPGSIVNPGQVVPLDGSGTGWFDSNGQKTTGATVSYRWVASDARVLITNPNSATTNFVVPDGYVDAQSNPSHKSVTFTLTATAGSESSSTATTFLVDPYRPFTVSVAPPAQSYALSQSPGGVATATMSAAASGAGSALHYKWTQVDGPETVSLGGSNTANAGFSTSTPGVYNFNVAVGYQPITASNPGLVQSMATVTIAP